MEGSQAPTEAVDSLAARIRAGSSSAEEELVATFYQRIYLMAYARTRDRETALDLTQDCLMAVIVAFRSGQLRDPEKMPHFVAGTARNVISNYLRTRIRRKEVELTGFELSRVDTAAEAERSECLRLVDDALDQLGPEDQRVLKLVLVEGMKPGDIATRLKLSSESVRTRKTRALKKVMAYMEKHVTKKPLGLHSFKAKP